MTKKAKILFAVVAAILIGCIGGLGYTTWMMWDEVESSRKEITKLKEVSDKISEAEKAMKKAKKDAKTQKEKAEDLQFMVKELQELSERRLAMYRSEHKKFVDLKMSSKQSTETAATSAPTPTAEPDHIPNGGPIECERDFDGTYTQGDKIMTITKSGYDYNIHIEETSPGAHGLSSWELSATRSECTLQYSGTRYHTVNGVDWEAVENCSGTIAHGHLSGNGSGMVWSDSSGMSAVFY